MGVAVLLAVLWQTDSLTVPLLGAIALVGGSLGTLSFPAFQGMLASTVPKPALESAVAVNSLFLQLARFIGPALAGFLLALGGPMGALTAALGLGSLLGSIALLALARRPNKGEPVLAGYFLSALAIAGVGVSSSVPLSLALAVVGGSCGVVFVGLSTVVVQAMASDEMRARAMLMLVGGIVVMALRPELAWLGCSALPEACLAGTYPAAVAVEGQLEAPASTR
jgi:predicted MFS family arabinose efflux permease